MQLNHEPPDYAYSLRAADGRSAKVNEQVLGGSFFLTPDQLVTHWPVASAAALQLADLEPILALNPALIVLGTGDRQVFPPAVVMAACMSRGIGPEVMAVAEAVRQALDPTLRLRLCLEALDERRRHAILLAYVHGYSHGEIAGRTSMPLGTVKAWMRRGLQQLRECVG